MAAKVFPGFTPAPPSGVSTESSSSSITDAKAAATNSVRNVDQGTVEKALAGMLAPDLAKELTAYFQNCFNYLFAIGATYNSRNEKTEAYYPPAYLTEPNKTEFMKLDTHSRPEAQLMGSILGNLQEAAKKGWLTPEQAKALHFFLNTNTREPQQAYSAPGQATSSQTDTNGGGAGQDEYEQFYKGMIEEEEGVQGGSTTTQAYYSNSSGGGTSGGAGGTVRLGMTGPGGGGSTGTSGTPPAGGFAPPPPPPPPPPPSSGMGGGGTPYDEYMNRLPGMMQTENDYLNNNFYQGDAFYGWFQNLFGSENWYRDFSAKALTELQAIKGAKENIMAQLAGIDASTPDGAKKLYMLQQNMSDVQNSERQIYDGISSAQKANDERKEMIKAIFEMYFQTTGAVVRNIGK